MDSMSTTQPVWSGTNSDAQEILLDSGAHAPACCCPGCVEIDPTKAVLVQEAIGDVAPTIKIKPSVPIDPANPQPPVSETIPGDTTTAEAIAVGGSVTETLNFLGDRDWFEVTLTDNSTYQFDLEGTGGTPVLDTYLRLYDSTGTVVNFNDDGGAGSNSQLTHTVGTGGTFYVEAAAFDDAYEGDYTLTFVEAPIAGVLPVASVQGTSALLGEDRDAITYAYGDIGQLSNYGSLLSSSSQAAWTGEEDWTVAEKLIVRGALDYIETLIDVTFIETTDYANASLDFTKNNDSGSLGTAGSWTNFGGGESWREATVRMNHTILDRWLNGKDEGGQGYETLVHEIGHALGLGHTHDTSLGSSVLSGMIGQSAFSGGLLGFNDPINSIMAYRDGWAAIPTSQEAYGNRGNFGAWDQQALINLYGEVTTAAVGDDTYTLPTAIAAGTFFHTIHDSDGVDAISAGGMALDATIDLRPATLNLDVFTSGGPVSHFFDSGSVIPGGFTIAAGTIIENGIGGGGNDSITGNDEANHLSGGEGLDTLRGGDEADTLEGGAEADELHGDGGLDTAEYSGSDARVEINLIDDTATGGHATGDMLNDIENVIGSNFNDLLVGTNDANTFYGGDDADNVVGRGGADRLYGESGADLMAGNNDNDTVSGGIGDDTLRGNGGDDSVIGGSGEDEIYAGIGNDYVSGGSENDLILGQGNDDTILGGAGDDTVRGGSGNDSIEGGSDNDDLFGQGNNDTIMGNGGNDSIQGNAGADMLYGGSGDDTLFSGSAGDRLDGGSGNDLLNGGVADGVRDVFVFLVGYDEDRINQFDQVGTDRLELDASLWSGLTLTEQQAIDMFGSLNGNGTIMTLDFGAGDILEVQNSGGIDMSSFGSDVLLV